MPEEKPWYVSLDGSHRREWYPNHWGGQHQGNGCVMLSPTSTFWGHGSSTHCGESGQVHEVDIIICIVARKKAELRADV